MGDYRLHAIASLLAALGLLAPQIRVGVEGVRVDVLVTDRNTAVRGLTAKDFEVRDNGVIQKIQTASIDDDPISALLVLDTSVSLEGEPLQHLKDAAAALISTLRKEDRSALITFSHEIRVAADWSERQSDVLNALAQTGAEGLTAIHDAAYAALTLADQQSDRRLLILIFSDGADTASWLPGEAIVDLARRSNAVIYAVNANSRARPTWFRLERRTGFIQPPRRLNPLEYFRPILDELAETTGGEVLTTADSAGLKAAFLRVLSQFRSRYLLTYIPTGVDVGGWHAIEVKLKNPRGDVRARPGYLRGDDPM
jgi:VWFA-related protein